MNLTDNFERLNKGEGKELYNTRNNARVISFILLDGGFYSVNYAYFIDGKFNPEDSTIELQFSTSKVRLKGQNLLELYEQILFQMRRRVACIEKRYAATVDENTIAVFEIEVIQG